MTMATTTLTDAELLDRFERIDLDQFRHADHVRVAWAYLERDGTLPALEALVRGLRAMAEAKGHPEKFHYTLTRAWLELIVVARQRHPDVTSAIDLLARVPSLTDPHYVRRFYSDAVLDGDAARLGWMPPDRWPFDSTL
jgi:hypothetical protein